MGGDCKIGDRSEQLYVIVLDKLRSSGALRRDKVVIEGCPETGCEGITWIHHTVICPV
jgi:hypothetical protein